GDGYVQPNLGEACDDNNQDSTDGCTAACQLAACGDGFLQQGESCDDGNTSDGDACPAACLRSVALIAATRESSTCAILDDGHVRCGGWNVPGGLGPGAPDDRGDAPNEMGDHLPAVDLGTGKTAVAIAGGSSHTCAILQGGSVKCWGYGYEGSLGLGDGS